MNTRGVSHIEVILAFILFIGFVASVLYFFSPTNNSTLVDSSLYYAFNKFFNNVSVSLDTYSVKITAAPNENIIAVDFGSDVATNKNVRVETYDGKVLPSRRESNIVYLDRQGNNFTMIKFSEDLSPYQGFSDITSLDTSKYTIASSSTEIIISEKRVVSLNSSYDISYNGIKQSFNLPSRIDFSFNLKFSANDYIHPDDKIPEGIEVFSDNRKEQVLRKDGGIGFADLAVTIW